MTFQYVDRIVGYESGKFIRGIKNVTRTESFFYLLPDGRRILSHAVVSESLAQLGSWLNMLTSDFKQRPVLLGDDKTDYPDCAQAGDQIDLAVEVIRIDDDIWLTQGKATVGDRQIVVCHECRSMMMPMEEFSSAEEMRRRFKNLYRPELKDFRGLNGDFMRIPMARGARRYEPIRFIDGIVSHTPFKRVEAYKNISIVEPFFQDHFPRRPIVPGVMLLSMAGEASQFLLRKDPLKAPLNLGLLPIGMGNIRCRKFVEPGDQCVVKIEVKKGDPSVIDGVVAVSLVIACNGVRAMQGDMIFRVVSEASPTTAGTN